MMLAMLQLGGLAPDFTLADYRGQAVALADFRGAQSVLLVLNRGFF